MIWFPEFLPKEVDSMKASPAFFRGLIRRLIYRDRTKVFVIGFHKTGTSSLGKALQILGYTVCGSLKGPDRGGVDRSELNEWILRQGSNQLDRYDAFQDTPWFLAYAELHRNYPDAKFILTTRDPNSWLKSVQKHFGVNTFKYHDLIYDGRDPISSPEYYLKIFQDHIEAVRHHFAASDNFLEFPIESANWKTLAGFLGASALAGDFPRSNQAKSANSFSRKMKRFIRRSFYK